MKKYLIALTSVIVFFILQVIGGVALAVAMLFKNPDWFKNPQEVLETMNNMTNGMALMLIICDVLCVVFCVIVKLFHNKTVFNFKAIEWKWALRGLICGIMGIFFLDYMNEVIEVPNLMGEQFVTLANSVVGMLAIAILGPICEELIFREALMGYVLRRGANKWAAIFYSAAIFGIVHFNPAQVVFAFGMGIILGILYYKTGNVVITSILHILNNSYAVALMIIYGDASNDMKISDLMGGKIETGIFSLFTLFICVYGLYIYWKRGKTYPYEKDYPVEKPVAVVAEAPVAFEENTEN